MRYQYQKAIIDIFDKFVKILDFADYQSKFTGDGWIVFSSENQDIEKLVVLGKLVCFHYPQDIGVLLAGIPDTTTAVRACISGGQDFPVEIRQPDGGVLRDWIGDSARRATSYANCAEDNQLLIDSKIHDKVKLDFSTALVDTANLPSERSPKHPELGYAVWSVGDLSPQVQPDAESAAYSVYLQWTGQEQRAVALVEEALAALPRARGERVVDLVRNAQALEDSREDEIHELRKLLRVAPDAATRDEAIGRLTALEAAPDVYFYSSMINIAPDYARATHWYEQMRKAEVAPNEVTFNTLINIAPDYARATHWYEEMRKAGVAPNEFTFSTLINIAPDYARATHWYEEMRKAGVAPNEVTFNTLINIAPDYTAATHWYEQMRKAGVVPDEFTTSTLASKAPDFAEGKSLTARLRADGAFRGQAYYSAVMAKVSPEDDPIAVIAWYFEQDFKHVKSLEPPLRMYASKGLDRAAMEFVVRWPQLGASERYMRVRGSNFLAEIDHFLSNPDVRPSALYAAGIYHFNQREFPQAKDYFDQALVYETHPSRQAHIERLIAQMPK